MTDKLDPDSRAELISYRIEKANMAIKEADDQETFDELRPLAVKFINEISRIV